MQQIQYVPLSEIKRVQKEITDPFLQAAVLADIFRLNALYMIMFAGSGHPGTTFSCIDIATWLWTQEMRNPNDKDADPSDIYFSSKGHDVPALYSILIGLEKLPFEKIHTLRRLGGLPGHPDLHTSYLVTNTGSLGMGISKAHGMAAANRLRGKHGRIYVLTGDGELQEGQIWESLGPAANQKFSEITVIVDHNKIQSDIHVKDTSDLGNLENKFKSFGWEVARADGHDFHAIKKVLEHFKTVKNRPQVLIADTLKGKGVSVMERLGDDGLYKFHSGAPSMENYAIAMSELVTRVNENLKNVGQAELKLESREIPSKGVPKVPLKLNASYGDELVKIARERKDIVGLDADLVLDTGLIPFKKEFPQRYIECGIAEQDMVSIAGGLALQGALPVVHSFSCFLSTRPNEQIYNNATEGTKIIYTASLAGLLPGTPGHSHQSVRDISCLGSVPGLVMLEPSTDEEVRKIIHWAVEKNQESTYIRIVNIPAEISYSLPEDYKLKLGHGVRLREGSDIAFIAYGPVMLESAMKASTLLSDKGISAAVYNLPWLNRVDSGWLEKTFNNFKMVATLDNHYVKLGQGEMLASAFAKFTKHPKIISLGLTEIPVCGQNTEVLKHHHLDPASVAETVEKNFK